DHHSLCSSRPGRLRPTRLLDVGTQKGSARIRLRTDHSREPYLALSHCWGDVPADTPWKLTMSNLPRFLERIDIQTLPLTFRHAVALTQDLGQRYFWID
ncbi:hypothetical protein BDV96DRAFT_468920, partial [Lophiotrema nucula]